MKSFHAVINLFSSAADVLRVQIHVAVALMRFPTLMIQRPSVWRYDTVRALMIGKDVSVGPFTEITVYLRTPKSRVAGKLILGDRVAIGAGCNIRAAGGIIEVGANTLLGQGVEIVAANHSIALNKASRDLEWDETRTGVKVGANCWLGAGCILLPGVEIGDNSVIAAGSIVTKSVPANEVWAGVPARFIRKIT